MATFYLTITDEQGNPLNGVYITNGQFNTTPANWGETSGPGGPWNGTSDSNGQIVTDVQYTCRQTWQGTLTASGWDDYPYTYTSGSITGDFYDSVQMVQSSITGGAPQNQGGNQNAGNLQDQAGTGVAGAVLGAATGISNVTGGFESFLNGAGLYATIAIVAIAIILIVVLVLLGPRAVTH